MLSSEEHVPGGRAGAEDDTRTLPPQPVDAGTASTDPASPSGALRLPGLPGLVPERPLAGRYTVLSTLGQGGMGVVLAAYDSRLDRRVALKLLRAQAQDGGGDRQARLLREAQAMARLNHPNVMHVYDTGTLEDGTVFVSMEYVEGQTLRQWQEQPRSWREVLEVYLAAGRGLAAAHEAGLVHRDFKPDNVLVGTEGRVRVTDFGLARTDPARVPAQTPATDEPSASRWAQQLTQAGARLGTPWYMAPEQLRGEAVDARSDLFSFCVALYEVLYAQPAFGGSTAQERMEAQGAGRINPPPAQSAVPAWVTQQVLQGLHVDPARRPASMKGLLRALEDNPDTLRRTRLRAAGLWATVAALATLTAWGWVRQYEARCSGLERRLANVWDEQVRTRVRLALVGSGLPYAADAARRVEALLDDYAEAWVKTSQEVCEAAGARTREAQGLVTLQELCLERRRSQLGALTELLAQGPDKELVPKAIQAAATLPPLSYCKDEKALSAAVPPPEDPAVQEQVTRWQITLDRLDALLTAGKYQLGLEQAEKLLPEVKAVGFAPLQARALYLLAQLHNRAGNRKEAERRAREALVQAAQGRDSVMQAKAWSLMIPIISALGRSQEALALRLGLEAAVEMADDELVRADALNAVGLVLQTVGQYKDAREHYERARALLTKKLGPNHPLVAKMHANIGNLESTLGQYAQAFANTERALKIFQEALGPESPEAAQVLINMGIQSFHLNRYEQSLTYSQRALVLLEQLLGPEHPSTLAPIVNLSVLLSTLGRDAQALAYNDRLLGSYERLMGPEHPDVAFTLATRAGFLFNLGRHPEALEAARRALALYEKAQMSEHDRVAQVLTTLGDIFHALGQSEEALAHHERSLALFDKALGPEHEQGVQPLVGLAEVHLARGRPGKALPLLERALARSSATENLQAWCQLTLARALWDSGGDRGRAVELASRAQQHWKRLGHPRAEEATRWLASHPRP